MTGAADSSSAASRTAELWREALLPALGNSPRFADQFFERLRAAKLTFGDRVHCPFLRPFFLSPEDEQRVRIVAEAIAALGERVVAAALEDRALFAQFRLRPEEERLARLHAGYGFASTASRLDAFLLPDSLKFAEYNGESPAGAGYSETLAQIFSDLPMMAQFAKHYDVHSYPLTAKLLDALVMSYIDWGGTSKRPQIAIVDWREVPTWSEFEILKERFEKMGVPVVLADPRDLVFDGKTLAAHSTKIDLVYRRVLINDIVARSKECEALVKAYAANAVCVANTFRCKIPHVKAFFAVLTDERNGALFSHGERDLIHRHIPWTRVVEDTSTAHYGEHIDLLAFIREKRENLVLKPAMNMVVPVSRLAGKPTNTIGITPSAAPSPVATPPLPSLSNNPARGSCKSASLSAAKFSRTSLPPRPSSSATCSSISLPTSSAANSPASSPASVPPAWPT